MLNYNFKYELSFQDRLAESTRILAKYPDRKPIICEKASNQVNLWDKFIIKKKIMMDFYIFNIPKKMYLDKFKFLYFFHYLY